MAKKSPPRRTAPAPKEVKEAAAPTSRRVSAAERPTSPHLSVYRWQVTNTLSILHRITGAFLLAGFVVLAAWLISAANGQASYDCVQKMILSPFGIFVMFGFTLAFYYHFLNGVRHLFWDIGWGFDLDTVSLTGITTVAATVALTLVTWAGFIINLLG